MSDKSVKRCLFCYQPIDGDGGYHPRCAKKLFGTHKTPILPYTRDNIGELALQVQAMVASGIAEGVAVKIIDKIVSRTGKWDDVIDSSFLKDELKSRYKSLVAERKNRIVK